MKNKRTTILLLFLIAGMAFFFPGCILSNELIIEEIPGQIGKVSRYFTYQVITFDPNNGDLAYSLSGEPEGMQISSGGLITWTPGENQIGGHTVEVEVSNGSDSSIEQFEITVEAIYLSSLSVNPSIMTINKGQSKTINSITAHYDDDSSADIELNACTYQSNVSSVTVSKGVITVSTACGVPAAKITVSYSEGDITKNATVNIYIPGGGG